MTEPTTGHDTTLRYDAAIDLESDSTHARVVKLVGTGRRVLELGPAAGHMSRVLTERGCSVVGIEVDPEMAAEGERFCDRVIVGDLDELDLGTELENDRFDVIVAADVLEHLKDPLRVLQRLTEFLAEDGFFVLSLPNVAHGSVRLALLEGHFTYQRVGLLDQTHLRFFTRESVDDLLDQAELATAEIYHQSLNIDASEVRFDPAGVPPEVMEALQRDPDARTYQWVIKAIPLAVRGMRELQRRTRELAHEGARLREENAELQAQNAELQAQNSALRSPDPELQRLQEALAAISAREGQLRSSLIDLHDQLFQRDQEILRLRQELLPLKRRFDQVRDSHAWRLIVRLRKLRQAKAKVRARLGRYRAALRKL